MIITKDTKLANVIFQNYHLIPIVSRFGIKFGFGDKSVAQICRQYKINPNFFLEIVNAFNDKEYLPYKKLINMPISLTVSYLLKSHHYYNKIKLPNIEKLIELLEWEGEEAGKNKSVLKKFFSQYLKEVNEHTTNEEKEIYPYVLELEKNFNKTKLDSSFIEKLKKKSIKDYADTHDELNSALLDLKNIMIKYLQPAKNKEITELILTEIFKLEADMKDHTKLENNVIVPVADMMEVELKKRNK
ncbi:MAG: hemerythrin domain-containing protein [Bacteroidales bacterium]|nr:hemerythrin domain-containing protein [Bacteroidales bacterium]